MAKKKCTPTVVIHLTVDGCILARQPRGVRVVIKDYATEPSRIPRDDPDAVTIKRDREGHHYILSDFAAVG